MRTRSRAWVLPPRWTAVLSVAIALGMLGSTLVVVHNGGMGASLVGTASRESSSLVGAHAEPIPFLPVHVHPIGVPGPATVDPTAAYNSEPAPMGIGDFGVGESGHPYTFNTTEFLGNFSWQSLNLDNGGNTEFTDQLNVVLQFTQASTTYAYWIQDVAFMDSSTGQLGFENNIWNFTTPGYCLDNSAVSGNGSVNPLSGCEGFYAVYAMSQPGASLAMPSPGDFSLEVRSYLSTGGLPEVAFEYWDGVTSYEVSYDNVVWPWAHAPSSDLGFLVDGNATAGSGNFYDAELTLGGPGGGSATIAQSVTNASSRLLYWNGHNLEAPRSVWNFGADTAEAISNVQSVFSHDPDGTPLTNQLDGTTRNATPARAYDQGRVGTLSISAPGITSGTVSVVGTSWPFLADRATLTLAPGLYPVWVNSTSQHTSLGSCLIGGGQTTAVTLPGGCPPAVSTPTSSSHGADIGQSVLFESTLTGPGSGGDTYAWGPIAAGLNCASSTSLTLSCDPTATGTYAVNVTVTDSAALSATSGTLEFVVSTDPTLGTPGGTPSTIETGGSVTFSVTASGGSGGFGYVWTNLPSPCSGVTTSSPTCTPASVGTYSVSVMATDSNDYTVTSSTIDYSVIAGPSVGTLSARPSSPTDVGQLVTFSGVATGGSGSYAYTWLGLPSGCSSQDTATLACTPTASGTSTVTLSVKDGGGGEATSLPLSYQVNAAISVGAVTASPAETDLGQRVTFSTAPVTGGTGVYTYSWASLPSGCLSANSSSIACTVGESGSFSPTVTVTDTVGGSSAGGGHLTVLPDPSIAHVGVSRPSLDLGQRVTFSALGVTGGNGVYSYAWSHLPSGCLSANATSVVCTPSAAGTFFVNLTVSDTFGGIASLVLQYAVYEPPTVVPPSSSVSAPMVGVAFTLSGIVTGGSGNFSYVWTGLPTGCVSSNSSQLTCSADATGTFEIVLSVTDSNGVSASSTALSLSVQPGSTTPGPSAAIETEYLLIGVLVAAAIGVAAVAVYYRRQA
jgi:hypothetical protein